MVRWNSVSYVVAVAARWTKSLKFTLSIAVHRGGLAKNHFWLAATQKKRIGEQLNDFWNMCPKPFSWAKNKRKLFFRREVERTALAKSGLNTFKRHLNCSSIRCCFLHSNWVRFSHCLCFIMVCLHGKETVTI